VIFRRRKRIDFKRGEWHYFPQIQPHAVANKEEPIELMGDAKRET
jgi:hypothetical protein